MVKKISLTTAIALSAATVFANDYIKHRIYSDRNFERNRAKAVGMLKDHGCRVRNVDADDFRSQPALEVEAFRDGRECDIILSYPDLRIIREGIDY